MKKAARFWVAGLLFVSLALVMLGCGAGDTKGKAASGKDSNAAKEKLVVGTDATYAPMEYMDKKQNIVGTDIDIVKAIAKEIGVEVEFKNYGWEPLFPAVSNGEVDLAVSSITITDERKQEHDFTDPYYVAKQVILVPDDSRVEKFQDLKDKRVSVQINTTGHIVTKELLGKTSSKIVAAETMPLAIDEMLNGNADAAVGDNSVVNDYQKNNPNKSLKVIEDDSFEKEYYGLMVKKGNKALVDNLNKGIQKIKDNGVLEKITGFEVE
ncbi:basic amino acid ABC transporter substrate-binding protein [Virgibacillus halophilus]|uniref:Basic amino acid ABC transporter substrate-binding protein n=1 Tax=Tigheibacillus halophilus TaxID=361280 RepID=A0ABU5C4I0_9BACI|nr:basic amino acid ABC transporter substrate-binding protein [Virgibacillus halophilus]